MPDRKEAWLEDGEDEADLRVSVILAAAGEGTRMGGAVRKPLLALGGVPILLRTLRRLASIKLVREILVAVHPEDVEPIRAEVWDAWMEAGATLLVAGGASRAESVWNALQVTDPQADVVAVHDAVRPFVPVDLCRALFRLAHKRGAAIPVLPVQDTIKRIEGDTVTETPQRAGLVGVQTPQVVRRDLFVNAYEYRFSTGGLGEAITDDASLVEAYGEPVSVLHGSPWNLKITRPDDLRLAEAMLAAGLVE